MNTCSLERFASCDRRGLNHVRTSWLAHGPFLCFILGGAMRAPKPDKSGIPFACGLRPLHRLAAVNLCKIVPVWIGPDRRWRLLSALKLPIWGTLICSLLGCTGPVQQDEDAPDSESGDPVCFDADRPLPEMAKWRLLNGAGIPVAASIIDGKIQIISRAQTTPGRKSASLWTTWSERLRTLTSVTPLPLSVYGTTTVSDARTVLVGTSSSLRGATLGWVASIEHGPPRTVGMASTPGFVGRDVTVLGGSVYLFGAVASAGKMVPASYSLTNKEPRPFATADDGTVFRVRSVADKSAAYALFGNGHIPEMSVWKGIARVVAKAGGELVVTGWRELTKAAGNTSGSTWRDLCVVDKRPLLVRSGFPAAVALLGLDLKTSRTWEMSDYVQAGGAYGCAGYGGRFVVVTRSNSGGGFSVWRGQADGGTLEEWLKVPSLGGGLATANIVSCFGVDCILAGTVSNYGADAEPTMWALPFAFKH